MPSNRRLMTLCAATAVAGALLPASGAAAADQVGAVRDADSAGLCGDAATINFAMADPYIVPRDGVVTRLHSAYAGDPGAALTYRIFRRTNDRSSRIVGVGRIDGTVGPDRTITVPARVPVKAGDLLGIERPGGRGVTCPFIRNGENASAPFGLADGTPFIPLIARGGRVNVLATVEPDADGNGFGDETQERCVVPKLTGATHRAARRRVKLAGCALGAVRGKGRVTRQSLGAGTVAARGTKVAIRLRRAS